MDSLDRRLLIVVRLMDRDGPKDRYLPTIAAIAQLAQSISRRRSHMAFSSASGETFGIFLRSEKAAAQIRAAIEGSTATTNGDQILVIELGRDFSAIGNSAGWRWLQHD